MSSTMFWRLRPAPLPALGSLSCPVRHSIASCFGESGNTRMEPQVLDINHRPLLVALRAIRPAVDPDRAELDRIIAIIDTGCAIEVWIDP